jgi:peptide/nickel transport system substrate-binding protein
MRDERQRQVDAARARASELENHLIDELQAGSISRREFVRRGALVGLSAPVVGLLVSACGSDQPSGGSQAGARQGAVRRGGTLRTATQEAAGNLDPLKVNNQGGLVTVGQVGDYLAFSNNQLMLEPRVAESWRPNREGSEWTFRIRPGLRFHDSRPLDARDVAATFNRLADPANASNALSTFKGVLSRGGAAAPDPRTVVFTLDAPTSNFPYYTSSDNYNAIILPRDYRGDWERTFIGSGPWRFDRRAGEAIQYVPNAGYWDPTHRPRASRSDIRFYDSEQSEVIALLGRDRDVVTQFSVSGGKALLRNPDVRVLEVRAAQHRQVHMRTDREPFRDKRVRQAVALLLNRRGYVDGLFDGRAELGNDSPFAPVYPSTDRSVPQRTRDVQRARALLAAAGKPDGFDVQLEGWNAFEMPDLAQLIQSDVREAGIRVRLSITDGATYFGDAVFGKSRWLDSVMGITDYAHRGVPDVLLKAPLQSSGVWNAAHFHNPEYDRAVRDYTSALDLQSQRRAARRIQTLLLDEVPILFPYFYHYLGATRSDVGGVGVTGVGQVQLEQAGFIA